MYSCKHIIDSGRTKRDNPMLCTTVLTLTLGLTYANLIVHTLYLYGTVTVTLTQSKNAIAGDTENENNSGQFNDLVEKLADPGNAIYLLFIGGQLVDRLHVKTPTVDES